MDLGRVLLGLAGIALGYNTLRRGVGHLHTGLARAPNGRGPKVERDPGSRVKGGRTIYKRGALELAEVTTLDDRINRIRDRARKGRVDPEVIAWARRQVTKRCPDKPGGWCTSEKDTEAEIRAIFNAMRRDVRYTSDPVGADLFVHPKRTLKHRAGDCDDFASLGCAALMAIGIRCRFKVIRTKNSESWDHIYLMAGTPKGRPERWISLDASVPVAPGWEVPAKHVAASRVFEVL